MKPMKTSSFLITKFLLIISLTGFSQSPNSASSSFSNAESVNWKANWIWYPNALEEVNFHFQTRKQFSINKEFSSATISITAYSDYILYVNNQKVGRGPNPNVPKFMYYDTYNIKDYLKKGENIIAVQVHNYAVGLHGVPKCQGGLIAQLEVTDIKKDTVAFVTTDESWKVSKVDFLAQNSPRLMWSNGFSQTFYAGKYNDDWKTLNYNQDKWLAPAVLGKHPLYPFQELIPRRIMYLKEDLVQAQSAVKGAFELNGYQQLSFGNVVPDNKNHIVYAQTWFYTDKDISYKAAVGCDDAYKFFVNGKLVSEQNYNVGFVTGATWNSREKYEQFHYGHGVRNESFIVDFKKGWNKVWVVIDYSDLGWGMSLAFFEVYQKKEAELLNNYSSQVVTGKSGDYPLNLVFSATRNKQDNTYNLFDGGESTGLKNSLDKIDTIAISAKTPVKFNPADFNTITDYDLLMRCEKRTSNKVPIPANKVNLSENEYIVYSFENTGYGYPSIEIEANDDAIVDVGYGNVLLPDHKFQQQWQSRYVDRFYLKKGTNKLETYIPREFRYMHISCRKGKKLIVKNAGIVARNYPVERIAKFSCSDTVFNKIWETSLRSTQILMQDGKGDDLKRECGVHNTRSFIHGSQGDFHSFGNVDLVKKAIMEGISLQDETGWFNSHGQTDNNMDEPLQMLWWFDLVQKYLQFSNDREFVKELYPRMIGVLNYHSKLENKDMLIDCANEYLYVTNHNLYIDDMEMNSGIRKGAYFGYSTLYAGALNSMAMIAKELGMTDDAKFYAGKASFVKEACNKNFWDKDKNIYHTWFTDGKADDGNSFILQVVALYYNICDPVQKQKLLQYITNDFLKNDNFEKIAATTGFYYFLLEVLFDNNQDELAERLMKAYYGKWIELGGTIFTGDGTYTQAGMKNMKTLEYEFEAHGYSTSALQHFYSNILGITSETAGYSKIRIAPKVGILTHAKGQVYTNKGIVSISWKVENGKLFIELTKPKECEYVLDIQDKYKDKMTIKVIDI